MDSIMRHHITSHHRCWMSWVSAWVRQSLKRPQLPQNRNRKQVWHRILTLSARWQDFFFSMFLIKWRISYFFLLNPNIESDPVLSELEMRLKNLRQTWAKYFEFLPADLELCSPRHYSARSSATTVHTYDMMMNCVTSFDSIPWSRMLVKCLLNT